MSNPIRTVAAAPVCRKSNPPGARVGRGRHSRSYGEDKLRTFFFAATAALALAMPASAIAGTTQPLNQYLVGHINPMAGVAAELAARGHRVAWAGEPEIIRRLAGEQAEVFPCAAPRSGHLEAARPPDLRGPEALKFLWEQFFVPLAESMADGVAAALTYILRS